MKYVVLLLALVVLLAGCASVTPIKYEPQAFKPPSKTEEYKLPPDPFASVSPPVFIFLKKGLDGNYVVCSKEESEFAALAPKELDKITLRISYLKDINGKLMELVNVQILRGNVLIDLISDQQVAKEIYRQIMVDFQNQANHDKNWSNVEKAGYLAIIIGQLVALLAVAL